MCPLVHNVEGFAPQLTLLGRMTLPEPKCSRQLLMAPPPHDLSEEPSQPATIRRTLLPAGKHLAHGSVPPPQQDLVRDSSAPALLATCLAPCRQSAREPFVHHPPEDPLHHARSPFGFSLGLLLQTLLVVRETLPLRNPLLLFGLEVFRGSSHAQQELLLVLLGCQQLGMRPHEHLQQLSLQSAHTHKRVAQRAVENKNQVLDFHALANAADLQLDQAGRNPGFVQPANWKGHLWDCVTRSCCGGFVSEFDLKVEDGIRRRLTGSILVVPVYLPIVSEEQAIEAIQRSQRAAQVLRHDTALAEAHHYIKASAR